MIQDIGPKKLNNHFENLQPDDESSMLQFREGKLLCRYDEEYGTLTFPRKKEMKELSDTVFLFSIGSAGYFLANPESSAPKEYSLYSMNEIRGFHLQSNESIFAAYTAFHLWKWYSANRFCGSCGSRTVRDTEERALVCNTCGRKIYPRINPAVIIGVINGERLLLTKYRTGFGHNALVAGFAEIGETMEETVAREVMEETGLKVKNIRYYKSQPWGIAEDLLAGFYCEVDGNDRIRMDKTELKYAEWVERQEIELQPTNYSLTNEMMRMFRDGKIH